MKISIAKTAGFCMGVRRAVDLVLDTSANTDEPIFTYGPLIHNPQVLAMLKNKGIPVIDDIPEKGNGIVLIRAHGVPPDAFEKLHKAGFQTIDATCPRVIKVQRIIKRYAKQGFSTIIIGDDYHPEVIGLNGYANGMGHVVNSIKELEKLQVFEKVIIVAQTTQNVPFYKEVKNWAKQNHPDYKVFDTICDSTEKRQNEIVEMAKSSDVVVVVGGKNSGNTQRLAELSTQAGKSVFHIEEESELDIKKLASAKSIAITAGASTPQWIINRVYKSIELSMAEVNQPYKKKLYDLQQFLLRTNLYLAFGAGCLCYACTKLQGIDNSLLPSIVAMLYILGMHILNHLTAIHSDVYNAPKRAEYYRKNKAKLAAFAIAAGSAGLFMASKMGTAPFVLLLIMSLMGLSYNLKIIPEKLCKSKYKKLSDIPGSKTILIAIAWGIVTAILPAMSTSSSFSPATIPAFLLSTGIVFARTVFFDILEMQGDRIAGQKTIPLLLGNKKTIKLLKYILLGLLLILPISSTINMVSSLGFVLCFYPVFMYSVLFAYEQKNVFYNFKLEFLIETHLILLGLSSFIWSLV